MKLTTLCFIGCVSSMFAADLSGTWEFTVQTTVVGTSHPKVLIRQQGDVLTGVYKSKIGSLKLEGTLKNGVLSFVVITPRGDVQFLGKVDASCKRMEGAVKAKGVQPGTFSGQKQHLSLNRSEAAAA